MGNNCTQWTSPVPIQYQGRGQTDGNFPKDLRVIALFPHEYYTIHKNATEYHMDAPKFNQGEIIQLGMF